MFTFTEIIIFCAQTCTIVLTRINGTFVNIQLQILLSINFFLLCTCTVFIFTNNNCFTSQFLPEYPFLHVQEYIIVLFVKLRILHVPSFKHGEESHGFWNVSHLEPNK